MTQALHIFQKDARRLWPMILAVLALFALLASSGVPVASGSSATSLAQPDNLLPFLTYIACWLLGAIVVQQDAPAQDSPFWLTRPYRRASLLLSKLIFLSAFVVLPLFVTGIVLEFRAGVSLSSNLLPFLEIESGYALWLIFPALAIATVTRSLFTFEAAFVALVFLRSAPARWLTQPSLDIHVPLIFPALPVLPMFLGALAVIALQYAFRRTLWNRVALVLSVLLSGILAPLNGTAVATIHALSGGFDAAAVRVSLDEASPATPADLPLAGCWNLKVNVENLPPHTILAAMGIAKAETHSTIGGIRQVEKTAFEETGGGYRELVCGGALTPPWRQPLKWADLEAYTQDLRITQDFAVFSTETVATMPVRHGSFPAGNAGRCEFLTPFPENTQLRCELPEPPLGAITSGLEFPGYKVYAASFLRQGMFALSPVYRAKFDGESQLRPSGWPLEAAAARGDAKFVLRREVLIGTLHREMNYRHLVVPLQRVPMPAPPRPK